MADILAIVKTLLELEDDEKNALLTLYINMVARQILNYCNISQLPEDLHYVAAQMVVEMYTDVVKGAEASGVSSVSEAGRSVSFNTGLAQLAAEAKLAERKTQLNRFRRPYRG